MTRSEFITKFRAEIDGWVLDAAMENRKGVELSMSLRVIRAKIESKLGEMYDSLAGIKQDPIKPENGTPKPPATAGTRR